MPETLIDLLRKRMEELREALRIRRPLAGQTISLRESTPLRGEVLGGVIGKGKVIEQVSKTLDELTARIKERKPEILPTVIERIEKWRPGTRVKELVPKVPTATTTTTSEEKALTLRE
jgi:hypothetical protein